MQACCTRRPVHLGVGLVLSVMRQTHPSTVTWVLQEAQRGGFWSYAAGTAYRLLVDFGVGGLHIDNYR